MRGAKAVAVVLAYVILGATASSAAELVLLKSQSLSGTKSFCVNIRPEQSEAQMSVSAFFERNVDGFFEIDGSRVYSWKDSNSPYVYFRATNKTYHIAIHVDSPVRVTLLGVNPPRDKQGHQISIPMEEVKCSASDADRNVEEIKDLIR